LLLGARVGRSVLYFVRHLAQLAGNAEIETRSRQTAATFCQLGEEFGVGHTHAIPAAGEKPTPPKRSDRRAGNSTIQCRLASVQPRLDRFKRRGFVARFDPFRGFQPRAGGFHEGLLMRGVVGRRPAKALQRELAAYANV
jgi:hypothetical protein